MHHWRSHNVERAGWLAIWMYVVFFVSINALRVIFTTSQKELPEHYLAPIEMAIYFVLFALFLFGIRQFAMRKADVDLTRTVNSLIIVSLLEMIVIFPYSFLRYVDANFLTLLIVATAPLLCVHGVLLIRFGKYFNKQAPELGALGRRIVLWNKIAGWMLASVILIIPGVFVALIAEFFVWRLLARSHKGAVAAS